MSEIQTRTMEEQGKPAASHILVVDDNPEIREVIYLLLGGEGYEVTEAANGEQAIEASAKYAFDRPVWRSERTATRLSFF